MVTCYWPAMLKICSCAFMTSATLAVRVYSSIVINDLKKTNFAWEQTTSA